MSENQPEPEEIEAAEVDSNPSFLDFTSRKNLYLFALGTGVFLGLVFLLPVFSRLVWIAAAPIFLCVRFRQNKDNFISGLLIGIPWFLISCYWLTYVTVFGLICLALFEGAYLGVWLLLAGRFPSPWRNYVFPVLWVACEFVRSKGPLGFSWNLFGHLAYPIESLAQTFGVYGLSLVVAAVGVIVASLIRSERDETTGPMPEGSATFLALPLLWLALALFVYINAPTPKEDRKIYVGVVQGNFPQSLKWNTPLDEALSRYVELTNETVQESHPDLVIWPEVAMPAILSNQPNLLNVLERRTDQWETSLLFGVLDEDFRRETEGGEGELYNSVVFLDYRSDERLGPVQDPVAVSRHLRGPLTEEPNRSRFLPSAYSEEHHYPPKIYDKSRLLPFGEYVPFKKLLPFIQDFVEKQGGGVFSAGREGKTIPTAFGDIGPLICFESTHPGLARESAENGANLLVAVTNDAWFGNTAAARQHALQSRFRAIETGRAVVRVANTGITALYLPDGTVAERLPTWQALSQTWVVPLYSHLTFQFRVGDFLGWLALGCLGFSLLLTRGIDTVEE
ncbi:MAG: apolipoprotein N-acyltransferase [Candidatus Omnitrophica bacterium]|nr:apolipoprotein N-acyltransferase [Candidatus Omnitrophota bacterium]